MILLFMVEPRLLYLFYCLLPFVNERLLGRVIFCFVDNDVGPMKCITDE